MPLVAHSDLPTYGRLAEEGTTLVVSSHRLREMQEVLTDASILSKGRLVASGPLEELCGGDEEHIVMEVSPLAEAQRVLDRMEGVLHDVIPAGAGSTSPRLRLRSGGFSAGQLNQALVEAGCTVSAIVPERHDLQGLFEELVDRHELGATA